MPDFLKKLLSQYSEIFAKITKAQKIIILGVVVLAISAFVFLISSASEGGMIPLYKHAHLTKRDFQRVKTRLDKMRVEYSYDEDEREIYVENDQTAIKLRAQLGLEGIVRDIKGFELFDNTKFSTTDFERNINRRRAITGNMIKHLEALDDIEKAEVTISFGERIPFYIKEREENPLTASVVITPAPYSDIYDNINKIRGIRDLIAKGISRLKPDNVIIMDHQGVVLTDKIEPSDSDEEIRIVKEHIRIREKLRHSYTKAVRKILSRTYTEDRYELTINLDLNWDSKKMFIQEVLPMKITEDNPDTPFDETKVEPNPVISRQSIVESFKGPSFIPEGPAGTEPNVGPGMKELADRSSDYTKKSITENIQRGSRTTEQKNAPMKIKRVSIAVVLDEPYELDRDEDGDIILEKGKVNPKYLKIKSQELKEIEDLLKSSIAYDSKRKDRVSVKAIRFDRKKEFIEIAEKLHSDRRMKNLVLAGVISVLAIVILFLLIRVIRKELARRRRLREEEFARQQQAMREAAMLAAEEEGLGLDIPPEDRARLEMQENAINLARERPEDVASLLKTWLVED